MSEEESQGRKKQIDLISNGMTKFISLLFSKLPAPLISVKKFLRGKLELDCKLSRLKVEDPRFKESGKIEN